FERLVQPLVGGIYAGDPRQLSIESTFPRLRQMEREHRSLIRAMLRNSNTPPTESGARYGQFKTLRGGLGTLIDALAARLPPGSIELNAAVAALLPGSEQRWRVQLDTSGRESLEVDGVIVAAPAHQGGRLLAQADAELTAELNKIEYASCAVVALGYERRQIRHPLDGFGFVVPLVEQRMILSCSFSSVKYSGRAPDDCVLLRVFIGGACQSGLLRLSRWELGQLAAREVSGLLGIIGEPIVRRIVRQQQAMPQYHVGHRQRVERIDARLKRFPTLALAGSGLYGVGVPRCVESAESAAEQILLQMSLLNQSNQRVPLRRSKSNRKEEVVG
ncbi:MAG: protoporphyrinogen oxidase, partial [Pirellulaceae bacterium]